MPHETPIPGNVPGMPDENAGQEYLRKRIPYEDQPVKPVTEWENNEVGGKALLDEGVYRDHLARVQALRDRQAAYLASLPTEPAEAIRCAEELLHPDCQVYPEGFEEALHLAQALAAMVKDGDLAAEGRLRDAAQYIADRVSFAMHRAARQLDQIGDILHNPSRVENETSRG